jgi:hypothetical protein
MSVDLAAADLFDHRAVRTAIFASAAYVFLIHQSFEPPEIGPTFFRTVLTACERDKCAAIESGRRRRIGIADHAEWGG